MDTFDMKITTTSLHDITHHDLFSPHRHTAIFFTYGGSHHSKYDKKKMRSFNEIHNIDFGKVTPQRHLFTPKK